MARPLAKSPFLLLAIGLWILACSASLAEDDDPNALNQQVNQLIEQGKYQEAIPIAERAVEVAKRTRGSEDPETAEALNNFGLLFKKIGDYAKAEPLLKEVLEIRQKVLGREHLDTAKSLNGKDEANRELVEQLNAKKRIVAQLSLQTTAASGKEAGERIKALEQEVENIEGKLARQGTDLGQARRALTATVEQVQAALPHDMLLVEYVRYSHYLGKSKYELRYGAVVLSADAPPRWATLGSAKEIEATLKRYQRLVRNAGDEEMTAILQKIYNEVWKPVEQLFPIHTNRVIVSPDGQLNFLSFATLLDAEKGFVAEKYSIQYVTSGRDLLREPQSTSSKQVIVMANPKFDGDLNPNTQMAKSDLPIEGSGVLRGTEKRDVEDLSFEDLGGTQQESDQLIGQFKRWADGKSLASEGTSKPLGLRPHWAASSSPRIPLPRRIQINLNRLGSNQTFPSPGSSRTRCTVAVWRWREPIRRLKPGNGAKRLP